MIKLIFAFLFLTISGSAHASNGHLLDCNLADGEIAQVVIHQMPDKSLQLGQVFSDGASSVKILPPAQWVAHKIQLSTRGYGTGYLMLDKTGRWIYYFTFGPNSIQGNADCRK